MESVDKKSYIEPVMTIRKISFADIIVTSGETGTGNGPVESPSEEGNNALLPYYTPKVSTENTLF